MILVIGLLPPPVHGASRVTERFCARLETLGLRYLAYRTNVSGRFYHFRRMARYAGAVAFVLRHRGDRERRAIVYQTGAGGGALYYQFVISLLCRLLGVRQIFHHHSFAYLQSRSLAMRGIARFGGDNLTHIALCHEMKKRLERMYAVRRVVVLSNASFLDSYEVPTHSGPGGFVLGHYGNLSVAKGLGIAIDVVQELRRRGITVGFRVAGPASDEVARTMLENYFSDCQPGDEWLGYLEPADVPAYMSSLDCLLFPSRYRNEASPLVVFESLRVGTPVIGTGVGCLAELLGGVGWVAHHDPKALSVAVERLMEQVDRRQVARRLFLSEANDAEFDHVLKGVLNE